MSDLTQTRPHALEEYVQEDVGSPDYTDPAELVYVVDHPSWPKPRSLANSNFLGAVRHVEKGKLTNSGSRSVSHTFTTAFTSIPSYDNVYAYRETSVGYLQTVRENVLFYNLGITTTGFTLQIHESEDPNGVIIKFFFE